jgi:PAS domain S-box-containing protein
MAYAVHKSGANAVWPYVWALTVSAERTSRQNACGEPFVDLKTTSGEHAPVGDLTRGLNAEALRLLVESPSDYAIFMLDPNGIIISWNRGAQRIKGYTADEIIGKHFSVFYPREAVERDWPNEELRRAQVSGRFEDEGWRVRKDGTLFWANVVITALRDADGRLVGYGKVSRDLSERRRAEQALRESEERFRLLIESTTDYAIFMLDPGGHVVSWNAGAERINGYSADDIIGKHFSTFYTPEAIATGWPQHELVEAARVGRFEDEGWRVRKDGTRLWANVVITALRGSDGELRGYAKVTRDMTQRKAHEERITKLSQELEQRVLQLDRTNRELAQRNAENESFVYSVSHDLRSPLVNLQGFSHELQTAAKSLQKLLSRPEVPPHVQREATALLSGDLEESLGFIRNAVKHLSNIIDGLLRLSRVGRIEYESKPVNVNRVVTDILGAMHTTVANSGAHIEVRPLPAVRGDRNAIGQIFANILGNALKSFDAQRPGVIQISATRESTPVFSIQDNGIGIPAEYRSKIFQVFQHVHTARNRGEGMGLAIVRRIVERHGGRIWFESEPGSGTTFFFTLGPAVADTLTGRTDDGRDAERSDG